MKALFFFKIIACPGAHPGALSVNDLFWSSIYKISYQKTHFLSDWTGLGCNYLK